MTFFKTSTSVRFHRYHIEYNGHEYEIVCPKYTFSDETYVIVIPWFLIPSRPYPIQVYLYACNLYSSNPEINQRKAADATRKKFGLQKFSHSTVSRSFKALEESRNRDLQRRFGPEFTDFSAGAVTVCAETDEKSAAGTSEASPVSKPFPKITDTAARREAMRDFLPSFVCDVKKEDAENICRRFVENQYENAENLLLKLVLHQNRVISFPRKKPQGKGGTRDEENGKE